MDAAESTLSLWKTHPIAERPSLSNDVSCDICVVGAGIVGLSIAYELSDDGHHVIVLDAHGIGAGETAQTTAHLASALDDRFCDIERIHGETKARLAYESHALA